MIAFCCRLLVLVTVGSISPNFSVASDGLRLGQETNDAATPTPVFTDASVRVGDWRNQRGLLDLITHLEQHGFSRILSARVTQLRSGRHISQLPITTTSGTSDVAIAVVSASPFDMIAVEVTGSVSERRFRAEDDYGRSDAAIQILADQIPTDRRVTVNVRDSSGSSSEDILIIETSRHADAGVSLRTWADRSDLDVVGTPFDQTNDARSPIQSGPVDVVRIPLHGVVGANTDDEEFFTAADFQNAMRDADRLEPSHVILDIDSPGGRIDTKEVILKAMIEAMSRWKDQSIDRKLVAVIREAGSAAAMITLACDEILTYPAARIGAAVAYLPTEDGPISVKKLFEEDPELAAKFSSFEDSLDREAAIVAGRSPDIGEAMKYASKTLWWSPSGGFETTGDSTDAELLVDDASVLTLTTTDVVKTGLGRMVVDQAGILEAIGLPPGTSLTDLGFHMRATSTRLRNAVGRWEADHWAPWSDHKLKVAELLAEP